MATNAPRVTVVIPNWNGRQHLPRCLDSLAAQTYKDFEMIVVDNASTDTSVEWVREHHPEVHILQREDNGGFSKAVNTGIRAARGRYVALLNNDTIADSLWLATLVRTLEDRATYHFAASKMLLLDKPGRLNAAGDVYVLSRLLGKNRGFGKPASTYATIERVLGACAGAALYRRELFDAVGMFDEDFFLMSEDTDFNLRCLIADKRCLYVPAAEVHHKLRASVGTNPTREMMCLAIRNEALVAAKDLPASVLILAPLWWPYRFMRQSLPLNKTLMLLHLKSTRLRLKAEFDGIRLGLAKRADVWSRKAIGTLEILRWLLKGSGPA